MTTRTKRWIWAGTILFTAVNAAGAVWALVGREWLHGGAHVALAVLGAYVMARLARGSSPVPTAAPSATHEVAQRLDNLQQSLDAVALEVERVGEAQRYAAKVAAARHDPSESPRTIE